jgi:hypothetical protein
MPPQVDWAVSHAMVPIVEPRSDGRLRVYFSAKDAEGRAQIGRVEVCADGSEPLFDPEPVLKLGALGAFDDSGVMTSCLVHNGTIQRLYYIGWARGVSVPFYTFVGCAESSDDGATFARVSAVPILERSGVDPYFTTSPWIVVERGVWRMWYTSGTKWEHVGGHPKHWYRIAYAESDDGIRWRREGYVCIDYADEREYAISRPCVIRDGDLYRMWYSHRGAAYRIGYAESRDGLSWVRRDAEAGIDVSTNGFDAEMIEYPFVYEVDGQRFMAYNGNGYGASGVGYAVLEEE